MFTVQMFLPSLILMIPIFQITCRTSGRHISDIWWDRGYAVIIGEFGGRYGNGGDPKDRDWQDALINYMDSKGMTDFFYWSWNPNSGDTGGILQDNWQDVWEDKITATGSVDGRV